MGLLRRSRVLKERKHLKKDLTLEEKAFQRFLALFNKKSNIKFSNSPKEFYKLNLEIYDVLKKILEIDNLELHLLNQIAKEMNKEIDASVLEPTSQTNMNLSKIKRYIEEYEQLISSENKLLKKEEYEKIQELIDEEKDLEKKFDELLLVVLREIKDLVKNILEKFPLISVIIPAYNEQSYIQKTVKSAKRQSYPNKEIIVINNASTDRTNENISPYTHYVVFSKEKGVSKAKNHGAKLAHGNLLVFLDADCVMRKDLLDK